MPFPILVAFIRCHIDHRLNGRATTDGFEQIYCSNHIGGERIDWSSVGFPNKGLSCEMIDYVRVSRPKKGFDSVGVPNVEALDVELVTQFRPASKD